MTVLTIILQSLLALIFVLTGLGKVAGAKVQKESFDNLKLPQWFRVITGLLQLVAAACLIAGYWNTGWLQAGAIILSVIGIGGVLSHVRVKDSFKNMLPIVVLAVIAIVLAIISF